MSDQKIVEKVLRSLTPKYNFVVAAIEESKDLSTLSFTQLMGSLKTHEERLSRVVENQVEQVFQSKIDLKTGASSHSHGWKNHSKDKRESARGEGKSWNQTQKHYSRGNGDKSWSRNNGKHFNKASAHKHFNGRNGEKHNSGNYELPICYNCSKKGHIEKDCWYKNKDPNIPICSICGKYGHTQHNYWYNKKN